MSAAAELSSALGEMKAGKVDAAALEALFKQDVSYRALVEREYAALSAAAAREVLQSWSPMYSERCAQLQKSSGELLVRADLVLTYVEGTGRYVEAAFLSDARFHSSLSLQADPHYQGYRSFSAKAG